MNKNNLEKLAEWWKFRIGKAEDMLFEMKNIVVKPNYEKKTIMFSYDYPENIKEKDIKTNNEMIVNHPNNEEYPIVIDRYKNIYNINTHWRTENNALDIVSPFAKLIKSQISQVP
jgi:hypothetical protein